MLFAGCSFTWGQSLHYYGGFHDDKHPKDGFYYENDLLPHHYQYNVDNRFATKVADYFGRKPIVSARNGNSNPLMVDWIYRTIKLHPTIDCVIVQTTSFARGYSQSKNNQQQIKMLDDLIDYCESYDIMIRFVHMDIGGVEPGMEERIQISEKIQKRTILFDGKYDWFHILLCDNNQTYDYRTVASDFKDSRDTHFNIKGHEYLTKIIIDELLKSNYYPIQKIELPKLFDNNLFFKNDLDEVYDYYNKNYSNTSHHQFLLLKNTNESCACDIDLIEKNLITSFSEKLNKYDLIRVWMLVYTPTKSTGFHSDSSESFYRYVYEIKSVPDSRFIYIHYDKFKSISDFEDKILYIGNSVHSFQNDNKTDTRIAIVFDVKKPIHKREKNE